MAASTPKRYAYAATLLGTSLSWAGSTFTLGAAGASDAASKTTLALPAGNDSALTLLAAAVNGNQPNQTFLVTYTDGTSSSFTQSLSDWYTPQNYAGESKALKMAYRIASSGAVSNGPVYVYGYSFAINSAKTVQSITLPNNRNVVVLAVDVSAPPVGAATPVDVDLATAGNIVGIVDDGSPVTNGGLDGDGYAYSANLTGVSISWSGATFTLEARGRRRRRPRELRISVEPNRLKIPMDRRMTNLAGYIIRYGTNAAALSLQFFLDSPSATNVEIGNLTPADWYFEVAAINALGVEGPFSNVVGGMIH